MLQAVYEIKVNGLEYLFKAFTKQAPLTNRIQGVDMQHQMRRKDREITRTEAMELLECSEYGILSTCGSDGQPYGIPLSYSVLNDTIYFHCALEGRKLLNIEHDNRVSFCVVGRTEVLPDQFATRYESVVVYGTAQEVVGEERQQALEGLLEKYSSEYFSEGKEYIKAKDKLTKVFSILVENISGKARR